MHGSSQDMSITLGIGHRWDQTLVILDQCTSLMRASQRVGYFAGVELLYEERRRDINEIGRLLSRELSLHRDQANGDSPHHASSEKVQSPIDGRRERDLLPVRTDQTG